MRRSLTIFDLPNLSAEEALDLANRTVSAHPWMAGVYDGECLADLVRRRGSHTNVLLLRLVQPDDEMTATAWRDIGADLEALGLPAALRAFGRKMRLEDRADYDSWRTELWFAAWLARRGLPVDLEPGVGDRVAEFVVGTAPRTWWEVKSLQDAAKLRAGDLALTDVHRRLRQIPEPYVLSLVACDLSFPAVAQAVKEIRAQLREHYANSGELPAVFEAGGLVVEANPTKARTGYLGVVLGNEHLFTNERIVEVAKAVKGATAQLPEEEAGVVVIDYTASQLMHEEYVVEACYGEESWAIVGGVFQPVRGQGAFRPGSQTRISAVVSYTRSFVRDTGAYDMAVIHNPYAARPLPPEFLGGDAIRQLRLVHDDTGRSRIVGRLAGE